MLCMKVGVTTASGSASSMHRGSWSLDDDGSDVHNAAGWIESWRRASGLRPSPRCGQVLARAFDAGICDWRIRIVGGKAVVVFGRRLMGAVTARAATVKRSKVCDGDGGEDDGDASC